MEQEFQKLEEFDGSKLEQHPHHLMVGDVNIDDVEVDWRKDRTFKNAPVVTSVRKQGVCGACWAVTAVGVMEGANAIHNGKSIELSE